MFTVSRLKFPKQALAMTGTLALALHVLLAPPAAAEPVSNQGYEISARSDRSDRGFESSIVELKMVLLNKAGARAERTLTLRTLENPDESIGDKSLVVFHSPRDITGTALLSHTRILDPDDQWLFLPALKRVKRISSVNKSGPFVGSEFAFEDFTGLELNKFSYRYITTEPCGALTCDVVEGTPLYKYSGYSRQVAWIDTEIHQIRQIEFYDKRGDHLKTLSFDDYRQYDGRFWRPHALSMRNHQTGKQTDLMYQDYEFGVGLQDRNFNKLALARVR